MNNISNIVNELRALGLCVIPSGGGKEGKSPDLPSWKQYQEKLPSDTIYNSWLYSKKPVLWGIVTGELSGVVIVDCDDGEAIAKMGDLLPHVRTPRGGGHYYFRHPGHHVKTAVGILPKIDIRGDGGFANVVGTNPVLGGEYRIEIMPRPETIYPWDKMPRAVLNAMDKPTAKLEVEPGTLIPEGERNATLTSLAGSMRRRGMTSEEILAALLEVNRKRCQPPMEEKEVRTIVQSVARYEPTLTLTRQSEPPEIISARALSRMNFPPLKSALPGMVVEGLTIITAKPKAGKGWWVLQTAYSVALGKNLFDGSSCERGRVLYMGLEDSLRRLQYRVSEINNSTIFARVSTGKGGLHIHADFGEIPDGLDLTTRWPKIDEGCIEYLEEYLDEHPDTRLIVIDIFKRIAKAKKGKGSTYEEDYESIQPIQELATRRRVSFLVVHHNRKAGAEDPIDMVSGTFGLTGGVDSVIVIQRVTKGENKDESRFSFVGRDIEEYELAMQFDKASHMWSLIGDADTHFIGETRKEILEGLGEGMLPSELAKLMGRNTHTIRNLLMKMLKDGQVDKDSTGRYTASGFKMDDRLFQKEK